MFLVVSETQLRFCLLKRGFFLMRFLWDLLFFIGFRWVLPLGVLGLFFGRFLYLLHVVPDFFYLENVLLVGTVAR